ncbi:NERD domain-containing protein [Nocardioides sp.]|uniref:nuclease-related domain-containing DEAD/DEAH box helicase n=1 Tax=Nocardioides sp. TaxID=35761 RepID=UPI003512199A
MPARSIPERPAFSTPSEQEVWRRLCDTLPAGSVVLPNLRLTDQEKDHEADLVLLIPGSAVTVLEVKGGSVWHDADGWWVRRGDVDERCHPVDQARDVKHALRRYVQEDPRWGSRPRVAWSHGVVTPYSAFGNDFAVPELPRWALHDRHDQADLSERVQNNGWALAHGYPIPNDDDLALIGEILSGRAHTAFDLNAEAADRAAQADRLTQEQMVILQVTRLVRRVEVRGGAGSGKTVLALNKAKDLTAGSRGAKAERVALICYSIGLAEYLKRVVASWDRRKRPAFVGTYEELGRQWGLTITGEEPSDFWEVQLPELMAQRAAELPPGHRFDAFVVDEAQDFAESWWAPLLGALRDEEQGGLFVFADENQRLFARFGRPPVQLVPLVLDHNLRNTRQIHEVFDPLAPSRMFARGGDGPAVRFVPASHEDALGVADDEVERLLDEGWDAGRVALLTTGHRHPEQTAQVDHHGKVGYWRSFWEGEDVFYGHVLGSKGLERACVVLCVNEAQERDRARERLYVGMSRATDRLVVVGDPDHIAAVGGPEVARRLGIG